MVNRQVQQQQRMGIVLARNNNAVDNNILAVAKLMGTDKGAIAGLISVNEELL